MSLGLQVRLVLAVLMFLSLSLIGMVTILSFTMKPQFDTYQTYQLLYDPNLPWYNLSEAQILDYGVAKKDLTTFLENSDSKELGLIAETPLSSYMIYLKKTESGLQSKVALSGLNGWWSKNLKFLFLFSGSCILMGVLLFIAFTKVSLAPIASLRRATEDIIAGRFEIKTTYQAQDEVGRIFEALKRLCTELERKEEVLESISDMAFKDGLTGLSNFRAFKERVVEILLLTKRHNRTMGIALVDVDHFKKFNDTYGHQQGDEVLKLVGKTLFDTVRRSDFVARYGGEEFVIIMPETDEAGVEQASEKLRIAVENTKVPHLTNSNELLSVTISVGVVYIDGQNLPDDLNYQEYIELCDKNLYTAKKKGRNCTVASAFSIQEAA